MVDERGPLVSHEDAKPLRAADPVASGDDSAALEALVEELARVVHVREEARLLALDAGFPPGDVPDFTTARIFWSTVIQAVHDGKIVGGVRAVARAAAKRYPANAIFQRYGGRAAGPDPTEVRRPGSTPWWVAGVFVLLAGVGVPIVMEVWRCGGDDPPPGETGEDGESGLTKGSDTQGSSTSGTGQDGPPVDGADMGTNVAGSMGGDSTGSGDIKPKPRKDCKVDAEYQDTWQPRCTPGQTVVREKLEGSRFADYKENHPKTKSCDTITLYSCL